MNKEDYNTLEQLVENAFHNTYAGLYTMQRSNKKLKTVIDNQSRIEFFNEFHEFFMTQNEKQFHLMGFIDAIIWFERSGWFNQSDEEQEPWESETKHEIMMEKQAVKEKDAIFSAIISFETGED